MRREVESFIVVFVYVTIFFFATGTSVFLIVNLIETHADTLTDTLSRWVEVYRFWLLGFGISAMFGLVAAGS